MDRSIFCYTCNNVKTLVIEKARYQNERKTMDDKLMYIPNDDTENYPFCKLQLGFETF